MASKEGSEVGISEDVTGMHDCEAMLDLQVTADLSALNQELSEMLDIKNTLRTPPPTVDLSPFECCTLQREEFEVLKSIYGEDLLPFNEDGTCFVINVRFLSDEIKEEDIIKIWFSLPANYPAVPPVFEIETNQSGSFNYHDADDLFDLLMKESLNQLGEIMIFNLINTAQEHMPELIQKKRDLAVQREKEDRERKERIELEDAFKKNSKTTISNEITGEFILESQVEASEDENALSDSKVEWTHYHLKKPREFIGSISEIVKKLPEDLQLSRIENVMREDLALRFNQTMESMQKSLWKKERALPQMYNLTPQIAFHGTRATSLPSIVHRGLVIPGQDNSVQVRSGSSLGVGIYVSPSAEFSSCYSDSCRLIVCAVLLGRMFKSEGASAKSSKFYSIISSSGLEWVIFNAAQVLPCYVIELHSKERKAGRSEHTRPPLANLLDKSYSNHLNEDITEVERKAKLLARSHKYLPFGYGPGKTTVIEEAASFDDDEEDYGDYQLLRYGPVENKEGVHVTETELQKYRFKDLKEKL